MAELCKHMAVPCLLRDLGIAGRGRCGEISVAVEPACHSEHAQPLATQPVDERVGGLAAEELIVALRTRVLRMLWKLHRARRRLIPGEALPEPTSAVALEGGLFFVRLVACRLGVAGVCGVTASTFCRRIGEAAAGAAPVVTERRAWQASFLDSQRRAQQHGGC